MAAARIIALLKKPPDVVLDEELHVRLQRVEVREWLLVVGEVRRVIPDIEQRRDRLPGDNVIAKPPVFLRRARGQRGRARALLDLLAESRVGLADELTPEQRQREEGILAHISNVQKELWRENLPPQEEKTHEAELASAEEGLEAFHAEVRQANPRYASIRYPEPATVSREVDGTRVEMAFWYVRAQRR